jgi:hypothetical protein
MGGVRGKFELWWSDGGQASSIPLSLTAATTSELVPQSPSFGVRQRLN